mmetsp:Transcript_23566/g.53771  ORF Transcript_23566/g.53771 Transcript_23566/m.53771 type:complete len:306 (-) Transcript_23566:2431-3348(-)
MIAGLDAVIFHQSSILIPFFAIFLFVLLREPALACIGFRTLPTPRRIIHTGYVRLALGMQDGTAEDRSFHILFEERRTAPALFRRSNPQAQEFPLFCDVSDLFSVRRIPEDAIAVQLHDVKGLPRAGVEDDFSVQKKLGGRSGASASEVIPTQALPSCGGILKPQVRSWTSVDVQYVRFQVVRVDAKPLDADVCLFLDRDVEKDAVTAELLAGSVESSGQREVLFAPVFRRGRRGGRGRFRARGSRRGTRATFVPYASAEAVTVVGSTQKWHFVSLDHRGFGDLNIGILYRGPFSSVENIIIVGL